MNVEMTGNEGDSMLDKISKENNTSSDGHLVINGISNGYGDKHSKKEHKSDQKDKDRHKEKHKHKDYKDKDRKKEKSSSDKQEREKHNSSSSKDKEKERKHKEEKRERERSEHKSNSSSKDKVKDKDKEHRSSGSSSKDKEKHSSSSGKDKDKDKEKDRHSSSHREREKDKDKEKDRQSQGSSSGSKDKHGSSGRDRHSSSGDKKHGDKHRSKEKERDRAKSKGDDHAKDPARKDAEDKSDVKVKTETNSDAKPRGVDSDSGGGLLVSPTKSDDSSVGKLKIDDSSPGSSPVKVKAEVLSPVKIKYKFEDTSDTKNFSASINDTVDTSFDLSTSRVKSEEDTEEDVPLLMRLTPSAKRRLEDSDEDDCPLVARKKVKKEGSKKRKSEPEEDFKPEKKKSKSKNAKKSQPPESPKKGKKKEEEPQEVWKWWEEEKKEDGKKWHFLEHKGPVFAPAYEPLPLEVKFLYNGKEMHLSEEAEEVATFYARMLDHDYTTKEAFNKNFFKDWRKVMTDKEKSVITDLSKCNFKQIHTYFVNKSEERKQMTKEQKKAIKEKNEELVKEYGFCTIDGHKEKIGNFKIEPPGLFRGRGEHPKMGMLKRRVMPEDVIINCSKDSKCPEAPKGHKWKEVRHDKSVTWLASWTENVQGQVKYVMLNPSSKLKGEKDWQKYETARKLTKVIDKIREDYRNDWRSKEMRIRQRAVAMYFIDKLALRAGNEKDEDQADTVGCCSLRVEHISLEAEKDGKEYVVVFDFLGKDSIRYQNEVSVEKRVFKNLQIFKENKSEGDDLFDRLNTTVLNKHLNELMEGLSAKVFRTYNASITLQEQLKALTDPDVSLAEKILAYNRANRAVAILCNHQRAIPKTHDKSMGNLKAKIEAKREQLEEAEKVFKQAKHESRSDSSAKGQIEMEKRKKQLERIREQLAKLEVMATDKEENKNIALGTSKLNYLDPRISVAWCKKFEVPIEKIYNKTQRDKFRWAIDMAGPDYIF